MLLDQLNELYQCSPGIMTWALHNKPDDALYYRGGVDSQAKSLAAIPHVVRVKVDAPRVISYHTSKSVWLPVSAFCVEYYSDQKAFVLVRDNFYDIKAAVISTAPVHMPYNIVHKELTQEQYDKEKQRCLDYKKIKKPGPEFDTDEWFSKDWSGDKILRHDGKIWRAYTVHRVYCEGMEADRIDFLPPELFEPYEDDKSMFTCSIGGYVKVASLLEYVFNALEFKHAKIREVINAQERQSK